MPLTSSVMRQSISNFGFYCCLKKIQMLRKKVELLLEQLQVCIFAEKVFGVRCTLRFIIPLMIALLGRHVLVCLTEWTLHSIQKTGLKFLSCFYDQA